MKKAIVRIPPPHPKQAEIEACTKKRILINAGRRAGKTFMVVRKAIREAGKGSRVLYVAPVVAQTDAFWEYANDWLGDVIAAGIVKRNKQKRRLEFPDGGLIEARTGNKPDHLRGGWGDYIILDEYAYQDAGVWEKVVAPMLADTDGTAVFISTPDKRNHFYTLYLKALDRPEDWAVFTFDSHSNPHLSKEALDKLTEDMTDNDYRQEILAEFLPGVGAVFILDPDDFGPVTGVHMGHRVVAGLDWGRKQDYTALSIGCADCQQELFLGRIKDLEYHIQRGWIANSLQKCYNGDVELLAEENAMGLPNIEQLRLDGIEVQGFNTTSSSKGTIVQALRLAFQQHDWKWIDDPVGWNELEAFEMTIAPSGVARYGAPEGLHDDTVMARMLMLRQATTGQLQVY